MSIKSKPNSKEYNENYDKIFGTKDSLENRCMHEDTVLTSHTQVDGFTDKEIRMYRCTKCGALLRKDSL